MSLAYLILSSKNSHSGKKQPVVQDLAVVERRELVEHEALEIQVRSAAC